MLLVIGYLVYGRTNSNRRSPNPSQKRKQRDSGRTGNGTSWGLELLRG